MAIPLTEEDASLYKNTGIYEACVFCSMTTKFWHFRTNNPVCTPCSKLHKVSELKNWRKKK